MTGHIENLANMSNSTFSRRRGLRFNWCEKSSWQRGFGHTRLPSTPEMQAGVKTRCWTQLLPETEKLMKRKSNEVAPSMSEHGQHHALDSFPEECFR